MPRISELQINGTRRRVDVDAGRSLLSVLRDDLELTGSKYGCGEGQCGACTVLVDGSPTRSCLANVGTLAGKKITTIEGLEKDGRLHAVQQAFIEMGAMQCAYCTSGMIMSAVGLLKKIPHPNDDQIIEHMDGNICRCGTYTRIMAAIKSAAKNGGGAL